MTPNNDTARLCGTCKHWGTAPERSAGPGASAFRQCTAVIHDSSRTSQVAGDAADPDNPAYRHRSESIRARVAELTREVREARAVVVDESGFFAALRCRGDFGCVLHEEDAS